MDADTEQIAFKCTFKDCNIDGIEADEIRGIASKDNTLERPLDEQRQGFEERLKLLAPSSDDLALLDQLRLIKTENGRPVLTEAANSAIGSLA
ncbi:hypothetical protein [Nitrobacter sp. TKz-YC02]|uniref:hypothetical protein n=1 Tax=Nitrobacter sp. TKz-YC02 TaxID=3398704 RepID=UPI003CFB1339